jgi:hypothetical protein
VLSSRVTTVKHAINAYINIHIILQNYSSGGGGLFFDLAPNTFVPEPPSSPGDLAITYVFIESHCTVLHINIISGRLIRRYIDTYLDHEDGSNAFCNRRSR